MVVSAQWSKITTCPAVFGAGLMSKSPGWSCSLAMGVYLAANPAVSRPGPGRPRAIDAYPEQSRRYPSNQVDGSVLYRYGIGPPFHAVNHVAALANTAVPASQPAIADDPLPCGQASTHSSGSSGLVGELTEKVPAADGDPSTACEQAAATPPTTMALPIAQATTMPSTTATTPHNTLVVIAAPAPSAHAVTGSVDHTEPSGRRITS